MAEHIVTWVRAGERHEETFPDTASSALAANRLASELRASGADMVSTEKAIPAQTTSPASS
jgi:hypothetical protein